MPRDELPSRRSTSQQRASDETRSFGEFTPALPPPPPPPKLGRFQVLQLLGQGAFGKVYRAHDPTLQREVAIKVLMPGKLRAGDEMERFQREARAAAMVQHPNICPVHEIGQEAGQLYIVMALVPGKPLSAFLKERAAPLPAKQAALIVRKLALALAAAHAKGIVHRDLKPANIMFDRDRKDVVIMDFGLARRQGASDAQITQMGDILGTPAYMAPEQARGDIQSVGPCSDIYSLGVILYEMLAGRIPFMGNATEVLGQVLHVSPKPPSTFRQGVDPHLERLALKAIAKDPAHRFRSMNEFAEALGNWVKGNPGPAELAPPAPSKPAESLHLSDIAGKLAEEHRKETRAALEEVTRGSKRSLRLILGSLVVVAGLAAVGFFVLLNRGATVTVKLSLEGIDLKDTELTYLLDDRPIAAKQLESPIELSVGEHTLVVHRKEVEVARYRFLVRGPSDGALPDVQMVDRKINDAFVIPTAAPKLTPLPEPEAAAGILETLDVGGRNAPSGVALSADGRWLMAAGYHHHPTGHPTDGWVLGWDMKDLKAKPREFPFTTAAKIAFDPRNGDKAAIGSCANDAHGINLTSSVQFFDVGRWREESIVKVQPAYVLQTLRYSPSGQRLLAGWSGSEKSKLVIWDVDRRNELASFPTFAGAFAPDNNHVFLPSATEKELELVRIGDKEVIRVYKGHAASIHSIACTEKYVAAGTAGPNHAIRVWDIKTGDELHVFLGHSAHVSSLSFSPDGTRLLSSGDNTIRLWDLKTGKVVETFDHKANVRQAMFSPGGRRAVSCATDGKVRVWQLP